MNFILARFYTSTIYVLKFIRKLFICLKSFYFLLWPIKIGNWYLTTKIEIIMIGLTSFCEMISIEITDSMKYMKKPIILPLISFTVFVLCIFQNGHFVFILPCKLSMYERDFRTITKFFRIFLTTYSKISRIATTNCA